MINWKRSGASPIDGPRRHSWPDMSEDLPLDILPASNEEYFPPPPSAEHIGMMRLANAEGATIYHSVTSCKFPCLGPTGAAFPLGDGQTSQGRNIDFDSAQLGVGPPEIGPAKQSLTWSLPVTARAGYQPGEIVTYYCRIHPFMRGAFEVTK